MSKAEESFMRTDTEEGTKNNSQGNIFLLLFLAASRAGGKDLAINCLQETRSPDPPSLGLQGSTP